ncbi:MAG TPA: IS66 family transposase [Gemmataceae bacterium]|nr:IS66 family transposase [Gemmataceae bacterium]
MDEPACPGCRQRDVRIAQLERRDAELEATVRDLLNRLNTTAANSSLPPSANPLGAAKPVVKKKSRRRRGGQPGHPPYLKELLPPERVRQTHRFVPECCEHCHAALPAAASPADPAPLRFQVVELPPLAAIVTEYQGHARTCPGCGHLTRAAIPAAVRAHGVGPRLSAALSYLTGCHGLSKRAVEEIAGALFDAPVALGTVANLEREMSAALAPAHAEALAAVRQADVKHADETSWKLAGGLRWLWAAATAQVAVFLVHARRSGAALAALLGERVQGIVCSDRWGVYNGVPARQRQLCWAHLKRDFQKIVERGGADAFVGVRGRRLARDLFRAWHLFRGGGCTRAELQSRLEPVQNRLQRLLLEGALSGTDSTVVEFCENVLALEDALWTFATVEGVEPTNNHMERLLRRAVLWRKRSFGSASEAGCHFVERALTAVQTLRLQGRDVLDFLHQSLQAHRAGLPGPQLVLNG